jgi:hypothetical protein
VRLDKNIDQNFVDAAFKSMDDIAYLTGLRDIIDKLGYSESAVVSWRDLARDLTAYKATIWKNPSRFQDVFQEEVLGYLENVFADAPPVVVEELGLLPHGRDLEGPYLIANAKRIFLTCEQMHILPVSLPAARIIAAAQSRIRADPVRKFKSGDGADSFMPQRLFLTAKSS